MANSTMSDVAKEAGVALTTVGRVLNGGYVSQEKRERVQAAIKKLGYVPNKMARSLKASESKLIGILMRFNANQVFVSIERGLTGAIESAGYNSYTLTDYSGNIADEIDEFISRKVDALMIISIPEIERDCIEKLQNAKIPVVMIERCHDIPKVDGVYINDLDGAKQAVKGMIKKGAKRVAFVGCDPFNGPNPVPGVEEERYEGYVSALEDLGLEKDDDLIVFTENYASQCGYAAAKKLVDNNIEFDAVFCTSDLIAAGFLQYAYAVKLRVPDDFQIAGYDDTIAKMLAPEISSISLDYEKIGVEAVSMALSRIKAPELPRRSVRVDTIYTER